MGLLDKLWDDVVAGPRPSEGLSKLRKGKVEVVDQGPHQGSPVLPEDVERRRFSAEFQQFQNEARQVTKGIPIRKKKPPRLDLSSEDPGSSSPSSPSGLSPLLSPSMSSPASRERAVRQSLFKQCNATNMACDLIVISALDK